VSITETYITTLLGSTHMHTAVSFSSQGQRSKVKLKYNQTPFHKQNQPMHIST